MPRDYDPSSVEPKWQKRWEDARAYNVDLQNARPSSASSGLRTAGKNPYYSLVMFPYPSGDKLHVGHWYNFAPADSHSRYMRMHGHQVFAPMGFDAFGLPAENYAIKTGVPPAKSTAENVKTMIRQLKRIGCMYDWEKMVNTSDPSYYRWTQWLFLQMYKNKLAYKKLGNVNFCGSCQTVLANEQVWEGKCERCGTEVRQKPLEQWYWKITQYAQKLLDNLDHLDWPEKTKIMQRNWIGRSEGVHIFFPIADSKRGIVGPMNWSDGNSGTQRRRMNSAATPIAKTGNEDPGSRMNSAGNEDPGNETVAGEFIRRTSIDENNHGRIHSPMRIVHVVFTPKYREQAFNDSKDATRILRILDDVARRHDIIIHEAAAMPDHVHILVSFHRDRDLNLDVVKKLKGASAREYLKTTGGGTLWGEGGHHENVDTQENFDAVILYIQNNPSQDKILPGGRILSQLPLIITVFTTRQDTLFGATFIVLSPEHPIVESITPNSHQDAVRVYKEQARKKTELQRTSDKTKTGESTGAYAVNPANGEKIPIWIADYVLMNYGTGAVMAVPGHDERDFEFAKHYKLPIREVVAGGDIHTAAFTGEGKTVNSEFLNGLTTHEAKKKMTVWLEDEERGRGVVTYHLRDWLLSRQRYWGAPIPIVYDPDGSPHPVPDEHLPWMLPTDVEFKPTGKSPLTESKEFIERTEKIFGKGWRPEFDTMDTFVCSSFYYLRYLAGGNEQLRVPGFELRDPETRNSKLATSSTLVDADIEKKWMPVSMYIGGPEHACMHLIYARFVMMALKDFGYVSHEEPFQKLVHQGLITNKGAKMSKSKGNVVSPDSFIERHGSDVFRMYLMFMGPFTDGGDWSDTGIKGTDRFVQRVWRTFGAETKETKETKDMTVSLHRTIMKVTDSMDRMHFNTAISALMEFLNAIEGKEFSNETAKTFTKLLAPLAPHLAEELWEVLQRRVMVSGANHDTAMGFVIDQSWPTFDPKLLITDTMTIVVQVNGKVRGQIEVASDAAEKDILAAAKEDANVRRFLDGKKPKKEIYINGKLVSLVIEN